MSFLDALSRRVANNKSWFDAYFRANAVSLDRDPSKCDRECRKVQTCAISNIDYAQYAHCVERGDGATVGGRYPPLTHLYSMFIFSVVKKSSFAIRSGSRW